MHINASAGKEASLHDKLAEFGIQDNSVCCPRFYKNYNANHINILLPSIIVLHADYAVIARIGSRVKEFDVLLYQQCQVRD